MYEIALLGQLADRTIQPYPSIDMSNRNNLPYGDNPRFEQHNKKSASNLRTPRTQPAAQPDQFYSSQLADYANSQQFQQCFNPTQSVDGSPGVAIGQNELCQGTQSSLETVSCLEYQDNRSV